MIQHHNDATRFTLCYGLLFCTFFSQAYLASTQSVTQKHWRLATKLTGDYLDQTFTGKLITACRTHDLHPLETYATKIIRSHIPISCKQNLHEIGFSFLFSYYVLCRIFPRSSHFLCDCFINTYPSNISRSSFVVILMFV